MEDTSENREDKLSKKTLKHVSIGLLAHVDAGKTTLAEGILYLTGSIRKAGRVDHQDTFLDNYQLERSRGITIFSKQAELTLGKMAVTLLDTPGHVDFSAEMERTLQRCGWRPGTCYDLMAAFAPVSDTGVFVCE